MTTALIYPPSSYATTNELVEMARVAAKDRGVYATRMRDEGKDLVAAVDEAIAIGERAGMPVEIFHLKEAYQPGWRSLMSAARRTIEAARARGVDVAADMYVYTADGTGLEATIPSWAQEGGRPELLKRPADPEIRARVKREVVTGAPGCRISWKRPAGGRASFWPMRGTRERAFRRADARHDRDALAQRAGGRRIRSGGAGRGACNGHLPT
jgi:N-acyl-D-aspartate/D-glutamate deacylase